jgi:hypothetical protein
MLDDDEHAHPDALARGPRSLSRIDVNVLVAGCAHRIDGDQRGLVRADVKPSVAHRAL